MSAKAPASVEVPAPPRCMPSVPPLHLAAPSSGPTSLIRLPLRVVQGARSVQHVRAGGGQRLAETRASTYVSVRGRPRWWVRAREHVPIRRSRCPLRIERPKAEGDDKSAPARNRRTQSLRTSRCKASAPPGLPGRLHPLRAARMRMHVSAAKHACAHTQGTATRHGETRAPLRSRGPAPPQKTDDNVVRLATTVPGLAGRSFCE